MNSAPPVPANFALRVENTLTVPTSSQARADAAEVGGLRREEFCVGAYRMQDGRLVELLVGKKRKHGLRYVGSVRPAVAGLRNRLFHLLRMLRVHTFCPFVGLVGRSSRHRPPLPEHKVAECQWVEANVKVWVEYEGWSECGHLVNPRVVGLD